MSLLRLDMVSLLGLGVQEAQAKKTPAEAGGLECGDEDPPDSVPLSAGFPRPH